MEQEPNQLGHDNGFSTTADGLYEMPGHQSVFKTPSFVATFLAFAVFGFIAGAWAVLLADLRASLSLSPGAFGIALTAGFVVALPAMVLGGRVVDWSSPGVLIGVTGVLMALALVGISQIRGYWSLIGAFMLYFAANSAYDVGINAAGIDVEQMKNRQVMAYFHAAFSGVAAVGALLTGLFIATGIAFRLLYIVMAAVSVIVTTLLFVSRTLPTGSSKPKNPDRSSDVSRGSLFRNSAVVLVALIVCFGYFGEGAIENWSAIYLRTWLTFPAIVGASGVALFHTAMAAGRLGGAQLIENTDRVRLLQIVGVVGAVGMTIAVVTTNPVVILLGLFVVGLSLSIVSPIGYSLAGDFAPGRSGEASSVVTFVGWGAFIVGPGLVGGLAEVGGLRAALATVVLTTGAISLLAYRIRDTDTQALHTATPNATSEFSED